MSGRPQKWLLNPEHIIIFQCQKEEFRCNMLGRNNLCLQKWLGLAHDLDLLNLSQPFLCVSLLPQTSQPLSYASSHGWKTLLFMNLVIGKFQLNIVESVTIHPVQEGWSSALWRTQGKVRIYAGTLDNDMRKWQTLNTQMHKHIQHHHSQSWPWKFVFEYPQEVRQEVTPQTSISLNVCFKGERFSQTLRFIFILLLKYL